jgi:hypothetical protein
MGLPRIGLVVIAWSVASCSGKDLRLPSDQAPSTSVAVAAAGKPETASSNAGVVSVRSTSGGAGGVGVAGAGGLAGAGTEAAATAGSTADAPAPNRVARPAQPPPLIPALGTAGPVLRVDMDMSGRPTTEVTELGYTAWPVVAGPTLSTTLADVTFTFASTGPNGSGVVATWSKAAVNGPSYARLGGDGITVQDGDAGAALTLTISGLPTGEHKLLTYHNVPSNVERVAPLDLLVDGHEAVTQLQPSLGALANVEVPTAYLSFSASAGQDVVISFRAQTGNVVVNGFELDVPDASKQASDPTPANHDEHADADSGALELSWKAAMQAVSHDVYFGADGAAVAHADRSSALFQGNQATTSFSAQGLSSLAGSYWRVDEVAASGAVTPGVVWYFRPRKLAFPEAEGYGRFAIGGRDGVVVHVTNLADSGPGSLRDAIETERGPRTVVFDVGGLITLSSRLSVNQSHITVAGQTAPGKGVCVRGAPFGLTGVHDVVMRHLRVRLGHGMTFDGMGMQGSDHAIFDHCSISWTIDEAFSSRSAKNITLQRTLISECLNVAGHANYPAGTEHGYAGTISGDRGSFHHNLLAHCEGRNWSLGGGLDPSGNFAGRLDIFNTVVYNWGGRTTDGGAHEVNFVNNYYKPGAASEIFTALNAQYEEFPGKQQYYFAGNVMLGHFDSNSQERGRQISDGTPSGYDAWVDAPFFPSHAAVSSAEEAYKSVLSDVGNALPVLDDHDVRVIAETRDGSYKYKGSASSKPGLPDHESDVGGYEDYPNAARDAAWDSDADGLPDFWEDARQVTEANLDADGNGYTELEEYLQWMATPHVFASLEEPIVVDLAQAFVGYTDKPSYTAQEVTHGTVSIAGTTATFKADRCGFASFQLSVKDGAGAAMTKRYVAFVRCPTAP